MSSEEVEKTEALVEVHDHPVLKHLEDDRTTGERMADAVVKGIGTWTFLIIQFAIICVWVVGNVVLLRHVGTKAFDPYPFILLNLMLSIQAAVTGPLLLLAGNRQQQKDRELAGNDYEVNEAALALLTETRRLVDELHKGVAPPKPKRAPRAKKPVVS
jgi:uncharacterized membrane protein